MHGTDGCRKLSPSLTCSALGQILASMQITSCEEEQETMFSPHSRAQTSAAVRAGETTTSWAPTVPSQPLAPPSVNEELPPPTGGSSQGQGGVSLGLTCCKTAPSRDTAEARHVTQRGRAFHGLSLYIYLSISLSLSFYFLSLSLYLAYLLSSNECLLLVHFRSPQLRAYWATWRHRPSPGRHLPRMLANSLIVVSIDVCLSL